MFGTLVGTLIGLVIATVISGVLIWIVGKLGLGIEVEGFAPAFTAAFIIALLWVATNWFYNLIDYTPAGGIAGAITHLILTAGFLYAVSDRISGLRAKGFTGAVIASAAIAIVTWLAGFALSGVVAG